MSLDRGRFKLSFKVITSPNSVVAINHPNAFSTSQTRKPLYEILLEMIFMEEFEYNGIWWLPENPKKKISGTLRFNLREDANLELIGSFKEAKDKYTFTTKYNFRHYF